MCGSEKRLFRTVIEDTELKVCVSCAQFGKVIGEIKPEVVKKKVQKETESKPEKVVIQAVVSDYAERIRKKRELLGMKQEEFAKRLSEKESIVHKLETGVYRPSIKMAQKLERILKIRLIEKIEEESVDPPKSSGDIFTIGDFIKIKGKG